MLLSKVVNKAVLFQALLALTFDVGGILSGRIVLLFSPFFVATQTFKRGLDPDNFVIPAVTSVSDVGATLTLMATLAILGV